MMSSFKGKIFPNIGLLPGSSTGVGGKYINPEESKFFTDRLLRRGDKMFVTEKMDGIIVGVWRKDDTTLVPLTKLGKEVENMDGGRNDTLIYFYANYVESKKREFMDILNVGDWIVGEWILDCLRGTAYNANCDDELYPYAIYEQVRHDERPSLSNARELPYWAFTHRIGGKLPLPQEVAVDGAPISTNEVHRVLLTTSTPYRVDTPCGAIWRWERYDYNDGRPRNGEVMKRAMWIRPDYDPRAYSRED